MQPLNTAQKNELIRKLGIYTIDCLQTHYYRKTNGHWFDRDTMQFFKCRISEHLDFLCNGKILFYTSEKGAAGGSPRRYSIREYDPETGAIETVGLGFCGYKTLAAARLAGRKIAI